MFQAAQWTNIQIMHDPPGRAVPTMYNYVGMKAIVKEKHLVERTPLSNPKPAEHIVNQQEQARITQLYSACSNAYMFITDSGEAA